MKILIIKTSSLGDIIHAFTALQFLRVKFPKAVIDWVVEKRFSQLIQNLPLIDHVHCIDSHVWRRSLYRVSTWTEIRTFAKSLKRTSYDVAFDFQGNCKSGFILSSVIAKDKVGFGRGSVPELPNLLFTNKKYIPLHQQNIRDDYLFLVRKYLNDFSEFIPKEISFTVPSQDQDKIEHYLRLKKPLILICPFSAWPNKQLTQDSLMAIMKGLQKKTGASFLLPWGTQAEKEKAENIQMEFPDSSIVVDKVSFAALHCLMKRADLILTMDSLPLHLAGLTDTPTFSFFGPSLASKYKPLGVRQEFYQGSCPYGRTFEKRCPILRTCSTGACLHNIDSVQMVNRILKFMDVMD